MEKYLNSHLIENDFDGSQSVAEQPIQLRHLTANLTKRALGFLDYSQRKDEEDEKKPFVLYYAFPNVHTPLVPGKKFRKRSRHGNYGDR